MGICLRTCTQIHVCGCVHTHLIYLLYVRAHVPTCRSFTEDIEKRFADDEEKRASALGEALQARVDTITREFHDMMTDERSIAHQALTVQVRHMVHINMHMCAWNRETCMHMCA